MSSQNSRNYYPPTPMPPLILVDTGETCIADGSRWRILEIQRASETNIRYGRKRKPKKVLTNKY